ncbi:ABC transporter ATP-binding protein [Streptomyces sp. MAR4 CNX-425]|uniref:ABC transporter ATP-binding protein n=1 Tax=Streptomyces sp. MAR4 CNX-425 TaxID=3406343 RepID=UPI003B50122B
MAVRLKRYRGRSALALFVVLLRMGLGVLSPMALLVLLDTALPQHDTSLLVLVCGGLVLVSALSGVLIVAETALTSSVSQRLVSDLRLEMFDRTATQPLEFYADQSVSEIQARLVSDANGVDRFFSQTVRSAVAAFAGAAAAAVAMLIIAWQLAVVTLVLTGLLSLLNKRFAMRRRTLARDRQRHLTELIRHVSDVLNLDGAVLGRTLGHTRWQRERFADRCEEIRDTTVRQRIIGAGTTTVIYVCFGTVTPAIYLVGGVFMDHVSVGELVALAVLQMRLSDPVQTLLGFSAQVQASVAMFERIMHYTSLPVVALPHIRKTSGKPTTVEASGLRFRYAGAEHAALDGVGLTIVPGVMNVVLGPSGSGKSTLALLLAGLLPPDHGAVTLDGEPADPKLLREHVTIVPQHIAFSNTSLRDNLCLGREDVTDGELDRVLRAACLTDSGPAQPDGLDTPVGESGQHLSGGERQRLALARALLAGGRVLILDETTSALDGVLAQRVHDSLRDTLTDHTIMVIAHRIPRLAADDRVIVLGHGRVLEQGRHDRLRAAGGAYSTLLAAQGMSAASGDRPQREEEENDGHWRGAAEPRSGARVPKCVARIDSRIPAGDRLP